jgi:hypothetical protein
VLWRSTCDWSTFVFGVVIRTCNTWGVLRLDTKGEEGMVEGMFTCLNWLRWVLISQTAPGGGQKSRPALNRLAGKMCRQSLNWKVLIWHLSSHSIQWTVFHATSLSSYSWTELPICMSLLISPPLLLNTSEKIALVSQDIANKGRLIYRKHRPNRLHPFVI